MVTVTISAVRAAVLVAVVTAASCAVGPRYERPSAPLSSGYEEPSAPPSEAGVTWKPATPSEATRAPWWLVYDDPQLDALERGIDVSNQTLRVAEAQFRQARALVMVARGDLFPSVDVGLTAAARGGGTIATGGTSAGQGTLVTATPGSGTVKAFTLPLGVAWEPDLWGSVRRSVEGAVATAQAAAANVAATRLELQAEVAQDYLLLRSYDAQLALLHDTVAAYAETLQLTKDRLQGGVASEEDVAQAATQLDAARAQEIDAGLLRSQYEHALAVLTGRPPAELSIARAAPRIVPPAVPPGVPSELLERRPDVAANERRVAAANAQIGVARGAWFPTLTLSGSLGVQSTGLAHLLSWPNHFWSLGAQALETLFDGGRRRGRLENARAGYDLAVANYRQSVLVGLQEVEDNLAAMRELADEARAQDQALRSAREFLALATERYRAGVVSYLDVLTAQATVLTREVAVINTHARQLTASVLLIRALGGGWKS